MANVQLEKRGYARLQVLEILARNWLLLALPFLVIVPVTVGLLLRPQTPKWRTTARIWVQQDPAIYADPRLGSTPAINQVTLLTDFLHSRSFALSVLQQTSLKPRLDTPQHIDTALEHFSHDWVTAEAVSNNFISIAVTMPDGELSYQTMQAIISSYQSTLQAQEQELSDQAVKLYGGSLQQAQDALTQSQGAVSAYIASHPDLVNVTANATTAGVPPTMARDPNLAALMQNLTNAQATYDKVRDRYLSAQSADMLSGTFAPFAFKVIDQPEQPTKPVRTPRSQLLKIPAIGFLLAMLLSAGIGAVLVLTHHVAISTSDLEHSYEVPILGEFPDLKLGGRRWQTVAPDLVRLELLKPARLRLPIQDALGDIAAEQAERL